MSWTLKKLLLCAATVALALAASAQAADDYPNRPIRLVVPYAPGGLTDSLGRTVAEHLSHELKQPVVVENRPGGGTQIGARATSSAAPDGYTLMLATSTTLVAAPSVFKEYVNPVKGLTPISMVATNPFFLVASASSGYKSVRDVVQAAARQGAKGLSYGSAGPGTPHHLIMEMFREQANINLVHVPYSGSGAAINGLFDGSFDIMITDLAPARGFIQSGRLKALAVAEATRSNFLPEVPTFGEAGLPNVQLVPRQGVAGPPNLPPAIVDRISSALHKMVDSPAFIAKCTSLGCDARKSGSPAEFREFILSEQQAWKRVFTIANIKPR